MLSLMSKTIMEFSTLGITWKLNLDTILTLEKCHIFKIVIKMSHKQISKGGANKIQSSFNTWLTLFLPSPLFFLHDKMFWSFLHRKFFDQIPISVRREPPATVKVHLGFYMFLFYVKRGQGLWGLTAVSPTRQMQSTAEYGRAAKTEVY